MEERLGGGRGNIGIRGGEESGAKWEKNERGVK